ncbi:Coenzyme PQQ synthesis protein E [Candidatus Methanoperedenaceae archaeon GB50]|nr:Coenzyme PQQ synthesis protein E [Candidatus Methanoperedenaceae archaeon GB50]
MISKFLTKLSRARDQGGIINYYWSRLLQEVAKRTKSSFGKPTDVIVLLTNRCNARCLHCHSWKLDLRITELTTNEWKKTLKELRKWLGPIFLSITGGETLLRNDSVEIAEYAAQLGFWIEFLTNGYFMDNKKAVQLVKSGVKRIKISLDGSKAEIHDLIRGKKRFFEKATRALETLAKEKHKTNKKIQIWAKTTIMSHNVKDLANIVLLVQKLGIDGVEFQALEPVYYSEQLNDPNWYKDNPLWIEDKLTMIDSLEELKMLKKEGYPILNSIENIELMKQYFLNPDKLAFKIHSHVYKKKRPECTSWVAGLQIMPDGGMKMCHRMEPFANVKQGNLKKLWRTRKRCWKSGCVLNSS